MSTPDAGAGRAPAWLERAAVPRLPDAPPGAGVPWRDEELTEIAFRGEQIGIPAWRVMVALGIPLPPTEC
jgi:hypothetical protein